MKVLYLIDTLNYGGSEKSLLDLTSHAKDYEPVVCQLYHGDALKQQFQTRGIRVLSLNLTKKYAFRSALTGVTRMIRHEKPDLIQTTLARANLIGRIAGKMEHVPVVGSLVSDSYGEARMQKVSASLRRKLKLVQTIDRYTSKWVDHFIANSQNVKNSAMLNLSIPPEKVTVIYRGRDPDQFISLSASEKNDFISSLGLPENSRVIVNVSRLTPLKGHRELLGYFAKVKSELPDVRLLIAGDGPARESLIKQMLELKIEKEVRLLGFRDDIPRLLASADLFVFPSHYEGHPGALVEAMLAGCAIIASDIPVNRETLADTGVLIPLSHETDFTQKMITLLQKPAEAQRMAEEARRSAQSRFDINTMAAAYSELYYQLLQKWQNRSL